MNLHVPCCPTCGQPKTMPHPLDVDFYAGRVRCGDLAIEVPMKLAQLLYALDHAFPRAVPKEKIYDFIYGVRINGGPQEQTIESYVSQARRAMREAGFPVTIKNARNGGYWLETVR